MKQRQLQVRMVEALVEGKGKVKFDSPVVDVSAGEYVRRFVRREGPFELTGEQEITAVLDTGFFEVVPGSERMVEVEKKKRQPPAQPSPAANTSGQKPPEGDTKPQQ